ncbi:MAG: hypothetical protein M1830_007547, partial [Pleopsidium flavum]
MVRSEARGVPNILVAPKSTQTEQDADIYRNGVGDSRGYYADGAYTAAPPLGPSIPTTTTAEDEVQDPQDAYYTSLRLRFSLLRATLRCTPPASAIAALDDDHPISLPSGSSVAFATWRYLLKTTDPLPAQLASLDQGSVLRLVRIVTGGLKRGRKIDKRMGAWVWGLLGKVREVGECGSEEVGVLRELGKRAVWVLKAWRQAEERGGKDDGDVGEEEGEGEYEAEDRDEVIDDIVEDFEHGIQQENGEEEDLHQGALVSGGGSAEAESTEGAHNEALEPDMEDKEPYRLTAHAQAPEREDPKIELKNNYADDKVEEIHSREADELAAAKE